MFVSLTLDWDQYFTVLIIQSLCCHVCSIRHGTGLRDLAHSFQIIQPTWSRSSTDWFHPRLGNSLPHLGLRRLSFFTSAAIRRDVSHHASITMFSIICRLIPRHLGNLLVHALLQLLQCRASLSTTTVDFTLFTRSFTYCVCVKVVDIMSSAFVSLWVCSFLGVLQALLMIDFSSIIVFLCASLGPGAFCCVLQHCETSVHHCHFG